MRHVCQTGNMMNTRHAINPFLNLVDFLHIHFSIAILIWSFFLGPYLVKCA